MPVCLFSDRFISLQTFESCRISHFDYLTADNIDISFHLSHIRAAVLNLWSSAYSICIFCSKYDTHKFMDRIQKDSQLLGRPAKNTLDLLHFWMEIAEVIIKQGKGREDDFPVQPSRKRTEVRPLADVQMDNVNHMPEHTGMSLPGHCKNVGCTGKSWWICTKCKVHLCFQKNRNCFENFHKNWFGQSFLNLILCKHCSFVFQ